MLVSTRSVDELRRSNGGLPSALLLHRGFLPPSCVLVGIVEVEAPDSVGHSAGRSFSSWMGLVRFLLRWTICLETVAACILAIVLLQIPYAGRLTTLLEDLLGFLHKAGFGLTCSANDISKSRGTTSARNHVIAGDMQIFVLDLASLTGTSTT